jgi:heme-degrading monooxygenase HmoA
LCELSRIFLNAVAATVTGKNDSITMILEVAILNVIPEKTADFEASFKTAQEIISTMKGWLGHQLQQCVEVPNRYILLVQWDKIEDHTTGFRESEDYLIWKKLLHHYYSPFPVVEHYFLKYEK